MFKAARARIIRATAQQVYKLKNPLLLLLLPLLLLLM